MLKRFSRLLAVVVLGNLFCWTTANAQNNRSAVSVTGVDTAACTVPDPCRTFDTAISKTNSGGEVIVLSSGGYGPFTVTKSVSIISPGGIHAALAPTTGSAITINSLGVDVILRNLWINSLGASDGIKILASRQVHVESCTISGFGTGINLSAANAPMDDSYLSVVDSFLRLNSDGMFLSAGTGAVSRVTVDRTRVENNGGTGIFVNPSGASSTVDSVIRESLLTSNADGISVAVAGTSSTNVETCVFVHNLGNALRGGNGSTRVVRVSQSYIANNSTGLASQGGDDLRSFGNNRIQGNGADGTFTSTILLK